MRVVCLPHRARHKLYGLILRSPSALAIGTLALRYPFVLLFTGDDSPLMVVKEIGTDYERKFRIGKIVYLLQAGARGAGKRTRVCPLG